LQSNIFHWKYEAPDRRTRQVTDMEGSTDTGTSRVGDRVPAVPLGRLLAQAERLLTRQTEAALACHGLTVDQWRVLDLLADGGGHPMSEIVSAIVVPGPTLTKIVDRLVDAAAVYRLVDARDRRRVLAFLSESGHALHARVAPGVATAQEAALAALGSDAPVLLGLLSRLADSLVTRRDHQFGAKPARTDLTADPTASAPERR
jgi:DNA-binding MarR family transcriptional regulator